MRFTIYVLLTAVSALAVGWGTAVSTPWWFVPKQTAIVDIKDAGLIARGEYL